MLLLFFFFKQKTAYEMRISDWSSDVCSSDLKRMGFSGVQNFPTVGLIDGVFRQNLEETGMSYALEVDMIRAARAKDLLTTPYVFDANQAVAMCEAGADIIVAHRSEEHTSELQSLMRISYAVFCLKKKTQH